MTGSALNFLLELSPYSKYNDVVVILIFMEVNMAENERATVIILCCLGFVGLAGIHRFYKGKVLSGLLWLFTGGLCGIGTILDLAFYVNKGKLTFD
jgi:hypothetical protein